MDPITKERENEETRKTEDRIVSYVDSDNGRDTVSQKSVSGWIIFLTVLS